MKRLLLGLVLVGVLAGGAYVLSGRQGGQVELPQAAAAAPVATLGPVKESGRIISEGRVLPANRATLSMPASGTVEELAIQEGAQVSAGQLLLRLAAPRQEAALAQAEAEVGQAQAQVAALKAGPRPPEVAAAQAAVESAQGQLDRLQAGSRPEDIAAAEAELAAAQASLQQVLEGAGEQQQIAASNDLLNAEAALKQAQAAYDQIKGNPDAGLMPQALQLEQATNAYNASKARLTDLQQGARPGTIAAARAQVQRAQAALAAVKAPPRPADLATTQAEVKRAQAQLDLLQAGNPPETIAAAEAAAKAAEAGVTQAEAALAENELRAPFAGTVAALDVKVGEEVTSGAPLVQLGDLATWQVETTDLTELNVVNVRVGDSAQISFDALPGVVLPGHVTSIKSYGESKQGDITYTVVIQPDRQDSRLRWNMTASVSIDAR